MSILTKDRYGDEHARGWCSFNKPHCSEAWSVEYEEGYELVKNFPEPAAVRVSLNGDTWIAFDEPGAKAFITAFTEALTKTVAFNKNPVYDNEGWIRVTDDDKD